MSEEPDDPLDVPFEEIEQAETVDAASPRKVRTQQRAARDREKEAERFWVGIMETDVGRRMMWDMLTEAGTFEMRFAASPTGFPDPHATFFHLGEKAFGERLHATLMKHAPAAVLLMRQEHDHRLVKAKAPIA